MPRNIEQLKKQYNSTAADMKRRGPGGRPGGGPGNMRGMTGKPKDAKKTLLRLLSYAKSYTGRIIAVLACMGLTTVTSLIGGYMLAPVINKLSEVVLPDSAGKVSVLESAVGKFVGIFAENVLGFDKNDTFLYIAAAMIILGIVYLIGIGTTYLQSRLMLSVTAGIIEKIRNDLFEKLQRLPVRYFDGHPTGEIMSRFTNDIDNIETMLSNSLTSLISGGVTLIGTLVFMITTSWILTLITVVFVPVFMFGGMKIATLSRKYYASQQAALGAVNGYMEETVTGQKVIKVFNHEDECIEEFGLLNNDMRDKQFRAQFWGGVVGPIMGNTSQISMAVTIGIGGVLMLSGLLGAGGLTVFSQYSRQFSMPINQISQQLTTVFAALAGAERVFEVMDTEPETDGNKNGSTVTQSSFISASPNVLNRSRFAATLITEISSASEYSSRRRFNALI